MSESFAILRQAIIAGDADSANRLTTQLIAEGAPAREILETALLPGMQIVGDRMKAEECFIPEVLLSARTMQSCLDMLKPHLAAGESATIATIVIGTVEGDVHDIGKNLVAMLLRGAGFSVIDLGRDVTPPQFVAAVEEHKPDVLGLSGLLTTTIPKMPETIDALRDAGLRDSVRVIVGGAPVTAEYAAEIGADAYGANASFAVDECRRLSGRGT
jgi:5-methyltetrahydrofolate--homocysteine methyltransferase